MIVQSPDFGIHLRNHPALGCKARIEIAFPQYPKYQLLEQQGVVTKAGQELRESHGHPLGKHTPPTGVRVSLLRPQARIRAAHVPDIGCNRQAQLYREADCLHPTRSSPPFRRRSSKALCFQSNAGLLQHRSRVNRPASQKSGMYGAHSPVLCCDKYRACKSDQVQPAMVQKAD